MNEKSLTGLDRAAIIFKVFGNSLSVSLFKNLSAVEMGRLRNHADTLGHIPFAVKKKVLEDYYFELMGQKFKEKSGEEVSELFEFLHDLSNEQIAFLLAPETPVTIALALSQLNVERQADVIHFFDSDVRSDILIEMNEIDAIPYEGVINIEQDLKEKARMIPKKASFKKGGSRQVAELLSKMDPDFEKQFVSQLQSEDPDLAKDISKYHLSFEDLNKLPVDVVRDAIRGVEMGELAMSLKGTEEEFRQFMISNLPQKAQIMMEDELRDLEGPQPRKKVEAARRKIIDLLMDMVRAGRFSLEDIYEDDMIE